MKTFKDLKFEPDYGSGWLPYDGSVKAVMKFDNGFGVEVGKGMRYHSDSDTYEMKITKDGFEWSDSSCRGDTLHYLGAEDVTYFMKEVQKFEKGGLTRWQKEQVEKMNPNKPVRFNYKVYDCEHDGDMSYAEMECNDFCREYGGEVVDRYWDGEDCGEAYITCEFPASKVVEVLSTEFFECGFY